VDNLNIVSLIQPRAAIHETSTIIISTARLMNHDAAALKERSEEAIETCDGGYPREVQLGSNNEAHPIAPSSGNETLRLRSSLIVAQDRSTSPRTNEDD